MGYNIRYDADREQGPSLSFIRTQLGLCGLFLLGLYLFRVYCPEGHTILQECLKGDGTGAEAVTNLIGDLSSGADPITAISTFCHEITG